MLVGDGGDDGGGGDGDMVVVVVETIKEACLWGTLATPSPTSPSLSSLFTLPLYSV